MKKKKIKFYPLRVMNDDISEGVGVGNVVIVWGNVISSIV